MVVMILASSVKVRTTLSVGWAWFMPTRHHDGEKEHQSAMLRHLPNSLGLRTAGAKNRRNKNPVTAVYGLSGLASTSEAF
jgi:hypothetical protein